MEKDAAKTKLPEWTWVWYSVGASLLAVLLPVVFGLTMRRMPLSILGAALHVGYVACIAGATALAGVGLVAISRVQRWHKVVPLITILLNGLVLALFVNLYILYLSGAD